MSTSEALRRHIDVSGHRLDGSTQLAAFARWVRTHRGLALSSYHELWQWSVRDLETFWSCVQEFLEVPFANGYDTVLVEDTMPGARWFPGVRTNFANLPADPTRDDQAAFIGLAEDGGRSVVSHSQLRRQSAALAATLLRLGVRPGDRVVGYLPNIVETAVSFYAAASIGAVWASVGADYEADAAIARLRQLEPTVLIGVDGYRFRGRERDRRGALGAVRAAVAAKHTIMVSTLGLPVDDHLLWNEAVDGDAEFAPVQVDFDHPLWVLFSSGTTGAPKGIVHGHGGVQLEMHKTLRLQWDMSPGSRLLWATSPSWVVWNTLVSAPLIGATAVLFEGSPTYPDAGALWRAVADNAVTDFGTSPAFLAASEVAGVRPGRQFDLSALRQVVSTGSPLPLNTSRWAVRELGAATPLVSVSGGTDVVGAYVGGVPGQQVVPGEIQARCLGVSLQAWDPDGRNVVGEVGELVVTRPMPSMPLRFWDDPGDERYRQAYFSAYPGVWCHGDWITVTGRGSVVVHGRSDATLNRNGIRMGSADIYQALEDVPGIDDSMVIGAELGDGQYWMPLFVTLAAGTELTDVLRARIVDAIRRNASPRHVPDEIIVAPGIPRTRTGKRLEVPIKRILQGAAPESVVAPSSVDTPSLLDYFETLARAREHATALLLRGDLRP